MLDIVQNTDTTDLSRRWDLYGPVHKGLRLMWSDFIGRLGRTDFTDRDTARAMLADLRGALRLGAKHLSHEDDYVHCALEQRAIASTVRLEHQHEQHRVRFDELYQLIAIVDAEEDDWARMVLGRRLYMTFTTFVAEDLEHMHEEETVTWPLLCELFTDAELEAIEMTILASLPPEMVIAFMRLMIPAMHPKERAGLLGGMQASAPPEAFAAVIEFAARPTLSPVEFNDLSTALKLAA